MHKKRQLDRILRVRTLQLGMTRAEEVRAHAKIASEADLAWWSQTWADRLIHSAFGQRAIELGLAGQSKLEALAGLAFVGMTSR